MHLYVCPSCRRHVHAGERRCPFCARALPPAPPPERGPDPAARLGRAALLTFRGAALAAAGASTACGASTGVEMPRPADDAGALPPDVDAGSPLPVVDAGAPLVDAGTDAGRDVPIPAYGVPGPPDDAGPPDAGSTISLYGVPSPVDAGPGDAGPGDAGPGDAGPGDAGGGPTPAYGAPGP